MDADPVHLRRFVVDVYSRRILGWRVATSMRAFLVTDDLRQAIDSATALEPAGSSEGSSITPMPGPNISLWR
ncbi:hypothetical protein [Oceanitalea stevensii]|uniref:Uncharacterized protein n=1 Tax=Oceanitalea stevensii TaxID=2763072 RepID=A0ABR8Z622_9MICO|nr:hypothetical protein [Oceanitalea stevensii]MBD8063753.1 hypothetical protein [Oceanitalea stevensii]